MLPVAARAEGGQGVDETDLRFLRGFGFVLERTRHGETLLSRRFFAACLLPLLVGYGDKAKDLFDTAQLGEKQFNRPHATKLYRQIVEEYPRLALRESG